MASDEHEPRVARLTRRTFLGAVVAGAAATTGVNAVGTTADRQVTPSAPPARPDTVNVHFALNGAPADVAVDPRVTLLDALRDHLDHTGTKKGCDHGQCGACTVHVDGRRVLACLTLAASIHGREVGTIEGLAGGDTLHPLQQAFIEHDGFQCGYCTSGQLMSAAALLGETCGSTDADVREAMSGNLCRCGAYQGIVEAIQSVRGFARSSG